MPGAQSEGYRKSAISIGLGEISASRLAKLYPIKWLLMICATPGRSQVISIVPLPALTCVASPGKRKSENYKSGIYARKAGSNP